MERADLSLISAESVVECADPPSKCADLVSNSAEPAIVTADSVSSRADAAGKAFFIKNLQINYFVKLLA